MFLFDITNNPLAASLAHIATGQERVIRELIREQRPQTPVTRAPETHPAPVQSPLTRLISFVNNISRVARERNETIFRKSQNTLFPSHGTFRYAFSKNSWNVGQKGLGW